MSNGALFSNLATSSCLWGHIVETNRLESPPYFRLKVHVVYKCMCVCGGGGGGGGGYCVCVRVCGGSLVPRPHMKNRKDTPHLKHHIS